MYEQLFLQLKECGADVDGAIERFNNSVQLYVKYVFLFPNDKTVVELQKAVDEGNAAGVLSSSHTLKGVAGNLGFMPMYNLASEMTNYCRQGEPEKAIALSEKMSELYCTFCAVIAANKV